VHELTVGKAVLTRGGIDACNPQSSELPFLLPTVAIGILTCFDDRLLGDAKTAAARTAVALGLIEDALMSLVSCDTAFHSWHDNASLFNVVFVFGSTCVGLTRLAGQQFTHKDFVT